MTSESDRAPWGAGTRAVHAGVPAPAQGAPLLPGPVLAAPYHLQGAVDAAEYGYGRDQNPTWTHLERALSALEGGESVVFASGMAAITAVVLDTLGPGDVLVAPKDAYPGIRTLALDRLARNGVQTRFVASDTREIVAATPGARLVWVETPANPRLEVTDLAEITRAARVAGALTAVDNTLATPLGQRPLDHGADLSVLSGTKSLSGHSDLLLGVATAGDPQLATRLRTWRSQTGSIPGPFEAWLAHRSLATLELRLERQSANALAIARRLERREGVTDLCHPGLERHPGHAVAARQMRHTGALVGFTLPSAEHANAFLGALELVADATSFGGVHTTAERRARWGTDAVPEGFIRYSAGCEDVADLIADIDRALDRALG